MRKKWDMALGLLFALVAWGVIIWQVVEYKYRFAFVSPCIDIIGAHEASFEHVSEMLDGEFKFAERPDWGSSRKTDDGCRYVLQSYVTPMGGGWLDRHDYHVVMQFRQGQWWLEELGV